MKMNQDYINKDYIKITFGTTMKNHDVDKICSISNKDNIKLKITQFDSKIKVYYEKILQKKH